jgi:hypothetical protein
VFQEENYPSWHNLVYAPSYGALFVTVVLFAFVCYEEVERYQVYAGPRGIRHWIFRKGRRRRASFAFRIFCPLRSAVERCSKDDRRTKKQPRQAMATPNTTNFLSAAGTGAASASPFQHHDRSRSVGSNSSVSSDEGSHPKKSSSKIASSPRSRSSRSRHHHSQSTGDLPPPVLVYHESARCIVFRDHLRRASSTISSNDGDVFDTSPSDTSKAANESETKDNGDDDDDDIKDPGSEHVDEYKNEWGHEIANVFFPDHSDAHAIMHQLDGEVVIAGYQPTIVPLPHLELGPNDEFTPLLESGKDNVIQDHWTLAEKEVFGMLKNQTAVVKTIKNSEWTTFLHRFQIPNNPRANGYPDEHDDIAPHGDDDGGFPFNSFVTSTSLLPSCGRKMRCFGAPAVYTTGVVFALPQAQTSNETEEESVKRTHTWSWPSGYSAKTEFNIDGRGRLLNGREEALVSLSTLRQYNDDYVNKEDYVVAGRVIQGGLKTVPYNEVFVRVGGRGRAVGGKDCATGVERIDGTSTGRSLDQGVGIPVALFVRTITFGHLISLFRTRARLLHVLGEKHISGIPLLFISPELGVRVVTEALQRDILRIAAKNLNPFQNPLLAHKTTIDNTSAAFMEAKLEELIDLDESIRHILTPEECARLAGGFGATDESIAQVLKDAMLQDKEQNSSAEGEGGKPREESHKLQDIVNEGLAAAVRSGDYYTSRQLLILYSLVASEGHQMDQDKETSNGGDNSKKHVKSKSLDSDAMLIKKQANDTAITSNDLPPLPPPPPLDTDRLRSATNSDGLLAVLGAAQVLKAMQDGGARKRTLECVLAVEEYVQ